MMVKHYRARGVMAHLRGRETSPACRAGRPPRPAAAASGAPADAGLVAARLERLHLGARTELDHRDAFESLVATVLSAQTTDVRVNQVTPGLFSRWPGPAALAEADEDAVTEQVRPLGMGATRARRIIGLSRAAARGPRRGGARRPGRARAGARRRPEDRARGPRGLVRPLPARRGHARGAALAPARLDDGHRPANGRGGRPGAGGGRRHGRRRRGPHDARAAPDPPRPPRLHGAGAPRGECVLADLCPSAGEAA
ncbi:endonuclease III [Brachybacterium sp. GPGPB12]|uniref:endonuclease III domain-containing protein n=1 Tax=Brachybacterium sp. GPGPB12 TaxID=3023517 RepID=UPI00313459E2